MVSYSTALPYLQTYFKQLRFHLLSLSRQGHLVTRGCAGTLVTCLNKRVPIG